MHTSSDRITSSRFTLVAAVLGALLVAGPAAAGSFGYADFQYDVGMVEEGGPALTYDHVFEPQHVNVSVTSAWLAVRVTDDPLCGASGFPDCDWSDIWESEWVEIDVDGEEWQSGYAGAFTLFAGEISAEAQIETWGDKATVTVTATKGDAWVKWSKLVVSYDVVDERPTSGVPEPGAAAVFALGLLLVRGATRRR